MEERTCTNCGLPLVRRAEWVAAGHPAADHTFDPEWVHKPHESTGREWAWYFCTIRAGVPLSSNPHAQP